MTLHPISEWIISNSVIALGLATLALVSSRMVKSPALTHILWLLVLIKLITPPIFKLPVELSREVQISPQAMVTAVVDENILSALPLKSYQESRVAYLVSKEQVLIGVWLFGSLAWLMLASYRSWKFNRRLKQAQSIDERGRSSAEAIAQRLKLKSLPDLVKVKGKVPPLLWSFFGRTTIAIPEDLWLSLGSGERETVLAHELAHYKRRDHWYRWVEWALMTVLWWHPLVWWARLGLRKAEEDSCDAWVLWALPKSARDYASALLKTFDFLSNPSVSMPVAACGFAERRSFKNVKERFTTILKRKPSHSMNKKQKTFSIALAVLVLPLSGYFLQSQVIAQEGEDPKKDAVAEIKAVERTAEVQAVESAVEQRLVRLEKMVQQLVESQEVRPQREIVPLKDTEPARDVLARQQNRMEQQKLHMEHSAHQMELAHREAMIAQARQEAELSRKKSQLEYSMQRYESGHINEQDLQHLQHEAQMAELEAQQQQIKAEAHLRSLEMNFKQQELQLKQLERENEPRF